MRVALSLIAAILLAACSATVRVAEAQTKRDAIPIDRLAPFLADYNRFLLLPMRQDCKNPPVVLGFPTCVIEVDIWLVNSGGIDYCLTQFPKETEFDRPTRVVWKLKQHTLTSAQTGKTYNISFHADLGIIALRDQYKQILGGGLGDGATNNRWWYHRFNLHLAKDKRIIYAPVILQTLSTDEDDIGVCAVGDPRMINE